MAWPTFLQPIEPKVEEGTVSFLNNPSAFCLPDVDWSSDQQSMLWRYNLHYFDFLHWGVYSADFKEQVVADWIAKNPRGTEVAWDPYPTSLRVVNWIKWLAVYEPARANEQIQTSLGAQLAWLEKNIEYHLMANHLFKNAKALVLEASLLRVKQRLANFAAACI